MSDDIKTILDRMPWRGKFTTAETRIFEARRTRLIEAMTDAVGIFGQVMYVDPAHLQLLAVHVAMAGDFFDDGHGQFIEARIRDVTDDNGQVMFQGIREWRKCGEWDDTPEPDAGRDDREAEAALAQIKQQLTPAVRQKLMRRIATDYTAATREEDQ